MFEQIDAAQIVASDPEHVGQYGIQPVDRGVRASRCGDQARGDGG